MKHVNKWPTQLDMEKYYAGAIYNTLVFLKSKNLADFERVVELGSKKELTLREKVELLELLVRKYCPAHQKEWATMVIEGIKFNEGAALGSVIGQMDKTREEEPMAHLLSICAFVENIDANGMIAARIVDAAQRHVPLMVQNGEIGAEAPG